MTRMNRTQHACAFIGIASSVLSTCASATVPTCRLDDTHTALIRTTLQRSIDLYAAEGIALAVDGFSINAPKQKPTPRHLRVYVVTDAGEQRVDAKDCLKAAIQEGEPLDALSVRGGCVVRGDNALELHCSAQAVSIFSARGRRTDRENPSLLYVLSHELAHVHQRRAGEYSGRTEYLALDAQPAEKLRTLQQYCAPAMTTKEREADAYALRILRRVLTASPYREAILSERGSLMWNVDLLSMTADQWERASIGDEAQNQPKVHPAFVPKELPTSSHRIKSRAARFVCDVMTTSTGSVVYPSRSSTHPSADERLRAIAEKIKDDAALLPETGGSRDFAPIATLQQDLSAAFLHMYRERGIYMHSIEDEICTLVNSPEPIAPCQAHR
jgi:hypothetical protein